MFMQIKLKDSQNFLYDSQLVKKLINLTSINKFDIVYEMGPGKGIITKELDKIVQKVIAVEIDKNLADNLKTQFKNSNTSIINGDFLNFSLPKTNYTFVSNMPFNLTAQILNKILDYDNSPVKSYLIMQYEAFLKYSGAPYYSESFRSILYKPFFSSQLLYTFSQYDFKPSPNAKIVFVSFIKKDLPDINIELKNDYYDFVAFLYLQKGKAFKEKTSKIFSNLQQKKIITEFKIDLNATISTWSYTLILNLFNLYTKYVSKDKKKYVLNSYKKMSEQQNNISKLHRNRKALYSKQHINQNNKND